MPRTFVPEEQQRATDLTDLKNNFRPTPNRVVTVESDADGEANQFYWDGGAEATNADGISTIESNISEFADGGGTEGLWRRVRVPTSATELDDLSGVNATDTSQGQILSGDGAGNFTGSAISTVTENNVALTDLSDVGTDGDSRPQLPDLPSIATNTGPSKATDLTTKSYVDGVAQGLEIKDSVDVATAGTNVDLTATTDPNPIDGVTLSDGEFVLLKDQTTSTENGIYVAATAADPTTWTRREDFDDDSDVQAGSIAFVEKGSQNADTSFVVTSNDPITVGTDDIVFSQFSSSGEITAGDGLSKTGQTLSVSVSEFAGAGLEDNGSNDLQLVNNSVTITAGDGLKNGGSVALGGTTTLDVEPADFAGAGLVDDGSDDLKVELEVQDSTSQTATDARTFNFGDSLGVTDDGGGTVTIDAEGAAVAVENDNTELTTSLDRLSFDNLLTATNPTGDEIEVNVNDDLSQYDLTTISTDDISEGNDNLYYTDARVKNDLQAGGDIQYSKNIAASFDLANASSITNLDVSNQGGTNGMTPTGIAFNSNGSKLLVLGNDSPGAVESVYEYDLTTNFDLSTASFGSTSFGVESEEQVPEGLEFNNDGTKMYVVGTNSTSVFEYDLGTGFDVSTASFNSTSFNVSGQEANPAGIEFNGDGTKMFIVGFGSNTVYEYDLTTGFDVSTASFNSTSFGVSSETNSATDIAFNGDGTEMFIVDFDTDKVYKYDLTTGFDVSTASFANTSADISSQTSAANGLAFSDGGNKMFISANSPTSGGTQSVYSYDVGSAGGPAEFKLDVSELSAADLFGSKTTDDLNEGSTNLYFTDERAQDAVGNILGSQFNYDDSGDTITLQINQGAGTGLDADTLDGVQGSGYAQLAQDETVTGNYTFDGNVTLGSGITFDAGGNALTNLADPTSAQHAATKSYVDGLAQSLDIKESVRVATNGENIGLASTTDPGAIDGVTLADGDRILLKDQATAGDNGIYVATTAADPSTWVRADDADVDSEVTAGMFTFAEEGSTNGDSGFVLTTDDPISIGDALTFTQFSGAGQITAGTLLSKDGNTLNVENDLDLFDNSNANFIDGLNVKDGGGSVLDPTTILNFGSSITVTDNSGATAGQVTVDVDAAGSTSIDVDDSGSDAGTGINNLDFGEDLDVTVSGSKATIDATQPSISDGGTQVIDDTDDFNFGAGLTVTDDTDGTATIAADGEVIDNMGQETLSGNGTQTQFTIPHGLGSTPSSWIISAVTDDASSPSHTTADGTNLTVNYDTAPPNGTNNLVLNFVVQE